MKNTRMNWVPTSYIGSIMNLHMGALKQSLVDIYDSHACYCCVYWIPTKYSAMMKDSDKDH